MEIIIYYILNRLTLVYRVITTRKRCSVNYRFIENCLNKIQLLNMYIISVLLNTKCMLVQNMLHFGGEKWISGNIYRDICIIMSTTP